MFHPAQHYSHWIFDMDGTLTVACHDFDAIREKLGLPVNAPILEVLAEYPQAQAQAVHDRLYEIEMELALQARSQPGARQLLDVLCSRGCRIGIVTRNHLEIAFTTLNACGLMEYFKPEDILGRECCAPKPDPSGVLQLMQQWGSAGDETVMVGDYLFDLESGHNAGARTVHFDVSGEFAWPDVTHHRVLELGELVRWIG